MVRAARFCTWEHDQEAHVVRRLGAAVVRHWPQLPPEVQDLLLEDATIPGNPYEPQLRREIEAFASNYGEAPTETISEPSRAA
jgi:hypothetical protein